MAMVRFTRRSPRLAFQPLPALPGFDDIDARMRKMMEGMLGSLETESNEAIGWIPAMEITESPAEMLVTAELPGIDKENVDITVDGDLLTITGEKSEERTEGDEKKYHLWERSYGSFRRSFTLPRSVDGTKIHAEFRNGVLKIRLPKTTEAQARGRKIDIEVK